MSLIQPIGTIVTVMTVLFLVFTFLWEFIYKFLGKTEKCKITLVDIETDNKLTEFETNTGSSTLMTLREFGINYPSACPGQGICGQCTIMAESKMGPISDPEKTHITGADLKEVNGFIKRLACQCNIEKSGEYIFKVKAADLSAQKYIATVVNTKWLTDDKKEIWFQVPEKTGFLFKKKQEISYKAGQYITVEVYPEFQEWHNWFYGAKIKKYVEGLGKKYIDFNPDNPRYTPYSIASKPTDGNLVKLIVRSVPIDPKWPDVPCLGPAFINNTMKNMGLKKGSKVNLRGPFGHFYLRDAPHEAVGIAGGSGMAPIVSIMETWFADQNRKEKFVFFIGERRFHDIAYECFQRWLEWLDTYPNFVFVPVLSGDHHGDDPENFNADDINTWNKLSSKAKDKLISMGWIDEQGKQWKHHTGFIPTVMKNYLNENSDLVVYECGPGPMLITCDNELINLCRIKQENTLFDDFFNISTPPTMEVSISLLFKKDTLINAMRKKEIADVPGFLKRIDIILIFKMIMSNKFSKAENFLTGIEEIISVESSAVSDKLNSYLNQFESQEVYRT